MNYMAVTTVSQTWLTPMQCWKKITFSADYPTMIDQQQEVVASKWCAVDGTAGDILAGSYGSEYGAKWAKCGSTASDKPKETTWRIYKLNS